MLANLFLVIVSHDFWVEIRTAGIANFEAISDYIHCYARESPQMMEKHFVVFILLSKLY